MENKRVPRAWPTATAKNVNVRIGLLPPGGDMRLLPRIIIIKEGFVCAASYSWMTTFYRLVNKITCYRHTIFVSARPINGDLYCRSCPVNNFNQSDSKTPNRFSWAGSLTQPAELVENLIKVTQYQII